MYLCKSHVHEKNFETNNETIVLDKPYDREKDDTSRKAKL